MYDIVFIRWVRGHIFTICEINNNPYPPLYKFQINNNQNIKRGEEK
jgi:hypothetical protein